jgi:hypothetical protein
MLGTLSELWCAPIYERSGSIASFCPSASHFRSPPINGHRQSSPVGPFRAKKRLMHCTNFEKNAGTHLHDTHRAVEEPSTASMADIGNSLSVPRANAFHMAKQSHQIRNLNVFERMHGIFDLAARPFVGVTGRESVELFDGLLPREGTGGEPWKILNLVFDDLTVL